MIWSMSDVSNALELHIKFFVRFRLGAELDAEISSGDVFLQLVDEALGLLDHHQLQEVLLENLQ